MELFSLTFLFLFLPISLAVYYLTPNKYITLLAISLIYYISNPYSSLLLVAMMVASDYLTGLVIGLNRRKKAAVNILSTINIAKNLLLFILASTQTIPSIVTALGVMVVALTGISYTVDVGKGSCRAEKNFLKFSCYSLFFGRLHFGPFVRYGELRHQIDRVKPSLTYVSQGVVMLSYALGKKIIIADNVTSLYERLKEIPYSNLSVAGIWALVISFGFSLYFTLSAYLDMAQAIGYLFSIKLPISFYYPFTAVSVDEFFARFNISVNEFIRRYVYLPLGAKKGGPLSASINIILVSMLISLWYGITINHLLWGVYLAVFIIIEQWILADILEFIPPFIRRVSTFCITIFSFVFMTGISPEESLFYIKSMFGMGTIPLLDDSSSYFLTANLWVLALCIIFCSSIYAETRHRLSKSHPIFWDIVTVFSSVVVIIISISGMVY